MLPLFFSTPSVPLFLMGESPWFPLVVGRTEPRPRISWVTVKLKEAVGNIE